MTPHVPLDRVLTAVRSVHRQKETAVSTPEPSVAEQAVIDRFGIFEPEERVAAAILHAVLGDGDGGLVLDGDLPAGEIARLIREVAASAAIAVMPVSPAEEALRRVEALAEELSEQAEILKVDAGRASARGEHTYVTFWLGKSDAYSGTAAQLRAAIAAPQTGEHATDEAPPPAFGAYVVDPPRPRNYRPWAG